MSRDSLSTPRSGAQSPDPLSQLTQALSVSTGSYARYRQQCEVEFERLGRCQQAVMVRPMRESLSLLVHTFEDLLRNIAADPSDIRVENALPQIMRRASDSVEEYTRLAAQFEPPAPVRERMLAIEDTIAEGARWLTKVLERMRANDGQDISAKVEVLSAVFGGDRSATDRLASVSRDETTDTLAAER